MLHMHSLSVEVLMCGWRSSLSIRRVPPLVGGGDGPAASKPKTMADEAARLGGWLHRWGRDARFDELADRSGY